MSNKLSIKCKACHKVHHSTPVYLSEFYDFYYSGNYEWLEEAADIPSLDENIWERSNKIPIAGYSRIIKIFCSFEWDEGETKKLIFMPALASLNGWDSYPNELSHTAIVECILKRVIRFDAYNAWIEVTVMNVMRIDSISSQYQLIRNRQNIIDDYLIFGGETFLEYLDYVYISSCAQGDIGAWQLFKKADIGFQLILFGDWDMAHDYGYIGNFLVTEEEIMRFKNKAHILEVNLS